MTGPVDLGDVSPRRYFTGVAITLGLLLALVAGDDSDGRGPFLSFLQWQLQSCLPMALMLLSHRLWARLPRFERFGPWLQLMISGVSGCLLFSPAALLIDVVLEDPSPPFIAGELANEFINITPPITLTWLVINAPFVLGLRLRAGDGMPSGADAAAKAVVRDKAPPTIGESPHFFSLIPAPLRGDVLYLQAELHYLAVITSRGRSLILYNLRDAIGELDGVPGLAVHRSYWVSFGHIEGFQRMGRAGRLTMSNGDAVPVSRRRLPALQSALEQRGLVV